MGNAYLNLWVEVPAGAYVTILDFRGAPWVRFTPSGVAINRNSQEAPSAVPPGDGAEIVLEIGARLPPHSHFSFPASPGPGYADQGHRYPDYVKSPAITQGADDHRWVVLGVCCLSLLIVGVDTTIVNVALPAIRHSLHASLSGLQWIVDAYTLVLASFLMLGGSTGDRLGRKRVFQTGLVTFVLGSALCAAAPTLGVLVAARAFQALGGAMLNPVALSIVRNVFHDPRERARAIGMWSSAFGLSLGLGPVLGGLFVTTVGWRYVFLVNVPVGLLAFLLTAAYVPESRADQPRRIDPLGQVLVILGLASLTYAIIEGQGDGWTSVTILALFAVALAAFSTLVAYELRRHEPLVDVRFFRSPPFTGAAVSAVCAFGSYGAFLFLNTLYLQDARGLSALDAGLYTLPLAGFTILFAPITGRLVGRIGMRRPLLVAGVALGIAPLLLTGLTPHTPVWLLFVSYAIFGIGLGLVNVPITHTAISGMPAAQAGVAGAIASSSRQVGSTIGIALVGAIVGTSANVRFGPGFAHATHPGWWLIVGFAAILFAVGALTTTQRAFASARDVAARLQPERLPS
ncbi:MAG TPA: MFS transporter [Solirubrobacteraceae bacterium]|nr:MFS transporter [Solirubrobacteraceae bacterium]